MMLSSCQCPLNTLQQVPGRNFITSAKSLVAAVGGGFRILSDEAMEDVAAKARSLLVVGAHLRIASVEGDALQARVLCIQEVENQRCTDVARI